jgi:hypothetical protein
VGQHQQQRRRTRETELQGDCGGRRQQDRQQQQPPQASDGARTLEAGREHQRRGPGYQRQGEVEPGQRAGAVINQEQAAADGEQGHLRGRDGPGDQRDPKGRGRPGRRLQPRERRPQSAACHQAGGAATAGATTPSCR